MSFTVNLNETNFNVSSELTHLQQVEEYRKLYNKLIVAEKEINTTRDKAKKDKDGQTYLEADTERERISVYWMPFIAAHAKAQRLKEDKYKVTDEYGNVDPENSDYVPDPVITLFMIIFDAIVDDWLNKVGEKFDGLVEGEMTVNQFVEALVQLTPGLRIIQDFRDVIIPADDNGEIARLIRDPIKRPVEIVQNIRDKVIDPKDNGEIAQLIRDPIKRPVKVVENIIKKIFNW